MRGSGLDVLHEEIQKIPLLDHHCHNIVDVHSELPFEHCFSEASGTALKDVIHTLAFKRDVREIAVVLGCAPTLCDVLATRASLGTRTLAERFFEASHISSLLLDDGLALDKALDLREHRGFVPLVKRVLRVETVAESILADNRDGLSLADFATTFLSAIDPLPEDVVAFKSIACYRSGLDIDPNVTDADAEEALKNELLRLQGGSGRPRIEAKALVDFIFVRTLEVATKQGIPLQLHTGFGDRDVDIRLANPAHLRNVLEDKRFAESKIVLLHASYPYMKEATFLCSSYAQVYIDSGLAVAKLSVRAMEDAVHDLIALAPLNKVMASTDAFAFPEGYYTAAKWTRAVLTRVLARSTADGDLSADEALDAARAILHGNAARVYRLPGASALRPAVTPAASLAPSVDGKPDAKFIRLLFCDGSGQRRVRVVPASRLPSVAESGVGITRGLMGMSSFTDGPAPNCGLTAVGEVRIVPDVSTRRTIPWSMEHEYVLTNLHETPGKPWSHCPRWALQRQLQALETDFGLLFRVGFEAEFYLLKPVPCARPEDGVGYVSVDASPYCSSTAYDAQEAILSEMVSSLNALGIEIEQLHCESGKGQYEMAIVHSPALEAADNLLLFRETICAIAAKHGLRATFLPKYFESDVGCGAHVHMSLWKGAKSAMHSADKDGMSPTARHFIAGILEHLPALLAFTAPHPNSYARLQPNCWAGVHKVWGFQNREAPLRACPDPSAEGGLSNVELKAIDGCANPYLALAAILAAGMNGLAQKSELPPPTEVNPQDLASADSLRLPKSLEDSVNLLEGDTGLVISEALGPELVQSIIAVRKAEETFYKNLSFADTARALVEKY